MAPNLVQPKRSHLAWPAIPDAHDAMRLALQYQFEQSQWWPPEDLKRHQFSQLRQLLDYAFRRISFYRKRLKSAGFNPGKKVTDDLWGRIPILTRRDIQDAGDGLTHEPVPDDHGQTFVIRTSGSTGTPVKVVKTGLCDNFFNAARLRHHLWHRRDFSGVYCAIRDAETVLGAGNADKAKYPNGKNWDRWSGNMVFPTGKAALLHIHTPIADQVKWLRRKNPSVLLTFPSNLREIARYCVREGITFENLKSIDTVSEVVTPGIRAAVREAWGLTITDMYSAAEIGYLALQCPEFEHYHIQSEIAYVEILDGEDRPCEPGQTGRVVVTPLHNVATPLIRYDVGDLAEVGPPCPCGRGLPVIKQVFGRVRNMLRLPGGNTVWPVLDRIFHTVESVERYQVIQKTLENLEVRLVSRVPLTDGEEDALRGLLQDRLRYPFGIEFTYHEDLERTRSGKFEDFKSEVAAPPSRAA